jgi:hypothetical protein
MNKTKSEPVSQGEAVEINEMEIKLFSGSEYAGMVALGHRDLFVINKKFPGARKTFKEWTELLKFEKLPVYISENLKKVFNL